MALILFSNFSIQTLADDTWKLLWLRINLKHFDIGESTHKP